MTKELAYRQNDGIDVTLLWHTTTTASSSRSTTRSPTTRSRSACRGRRPSTPSTTPSPTRPSSTLGRGLTGAPFPSGVVTLLFVDIEDSTGHGPAARRRVHPRAGGVPLGGSRRRRGGRRTRGRLSRGRALRRVRARPRARSPRPSSAQKLLARAVVKARMGIHTGRPALAGDDVLRRRRAPGGADLRRRSRRPDPRVRRHPRGAERRRSRCATSGRTSCAACRGPSGSCSSWRRGSSLTSRRSGSIVNLWTKWTRNRRRRACASCWRRTPFSCARESRGCSRTAASRSSARPGTPTSCC